MSITQIRNLGVKVIKCGIPEHADIDIVRKIILLNGITITGIITLIIMGTISLSNNNLDIFILDYTIAAILSINILNMKKTSDFAISSIIGVSFAGILFVYLFATGGDHNTGHLWLFTFPLIAYFLLGSKKGTFALLFLLLPILIFLIINLHVPYFAVYPKDLVIRLLASFFVVGLFSFLFEITRENTQKKLILKNMELNHLIKELKKAEQDLMEAGERLELRVKERTRELSDVNSNLREEIRERKQAEADRQQIEVQLIRAQKMEAVGTLAGGVAHDLNNVLGGIVGYPELLLLELPNDSPMRKSIHTIKKSGEKAAAIVEDLLTLSRRSVSVKETLSLNDIVSDYLESPEFEKLKLYHPGVNVEASYGQDTALMEGSPVHLFKAVMNLVSNAAEAMPDGGEINISTEMLQVGKGNNLPVDLDSGEYIWLQISDKGEGIPQEDLERIFEPFFTKKKMGKSGTGLGMAVVWNTIKDHEGHIYVQSEVGKGTTFQICFPAGSEKGPVKKSESEIDRIMGNGECILIVDDMEEQREVAAFLLEKLGYCVQSVASGEAALDYMKSKDCDMLLLDMIMDPGMDGLDTYREIKKLKPHQRAIITSGYSETDRVQECMDLGATIYVKKPFTIEKIGKAVREALG